MRPVLASAVLLVGCVCTLFPARTAGQELRGTLLDAGSRKPVEGGRLFLHGAADVVVAEAVSDRSGSFRFLLARPGTFVLRIVHPEYPGIRRDSVRVERNELVTVTVALDSAMALEPLRVEARARRPMEWLGVFHERRQFFEPFGAKYFTRSDFEWLAATTVSEVIVSLQPSYFWTGAPLPGRDGQSSGRPRIATRRFNSICEPVYYVNYQRVRLNMRDEPEARVEDFVNLRDVTAIEVYRPGVSAPGGVAGGCGGAIVFWTLGPDTVPHDGALPLELAAHQYPSGVAMFPV